MDDRLRLLTAARQVGHALRDPNDGMSVPTPIWGARPQAAAVPVPGSTALAHALQAFAVRLRTELLTREDILAQLQALVDDFSGPASEQLAELGVIEEAKKPGGGAPAGEADPMAALAGMLGGGAPAGGGGGGGGGAPGGPGGEEGGPPKAPPLSSMTPDQQKAVVTVLMARADGSRQNSGISLKQVGGTAQDPKLGIPSEFPTAYHFVTDYRGNLLAAVTEVKTLPGAVWTDIEVSVGRGDDAMRRSASAWNYGQDKMEAVTALHEAQRLYAEAEKALLARVTEMGLVDRALLSGEKPTTPAAPVPTPTPVSVQAPPAQYQAAQPSVVPQIQQASAGLGRTW